MKKKIMAVTLCLAMVSTFAVGCGQKNETDSGKSEEKSYYYWQRKFRQEAAGQVSVPSATDSVPVTFAEIPFAYRDKPSGSAPTDTVAAVQPTAVFKYKDLTVAVTNEISDTLLSRIIREVTHA